MNHKKTGEKGISIIYAMLVSSVVLAVGTAVASIAAREVTLSSFSRESQAAYFAADAGINCALWYDLKAPGLLLGAFSPLNPTPTSISCNGENFSVGGEQTPSPQETTTILDMCFADASASDDVSVVFHPSYSVEVKVIKTETETGDPAIRDDNDFATMIESRGYNSCDPTYVRRVERAIRVTY